MNTPVFKASLDTASKMVSFMLAIFSLSFPLFSYLSGNSEAWAFCLPLLPLIIIVGGTYLYSPKGYALDSEFLYIVRIADKKKIARKDIASVQSVSPEELGRVWRMFGNGGLFGYTGWFSTALGKMRWYVSQRKNYVLLTMTNNAKILLSPDDVTSFIHAIEP